MSKITLQDIANELDLSRVTISKVINHKPGVAEETRERVFHALYKYNYKNYQELVKQAPTRQQSYHIAILSIAPDFSEFWLTIIRSISQKLEAQNHQSTYFFLGANPDESYNLPPGFDAEHIDGAIVINVYDNLLINQLVARDIPSVYLDVPVNRVRDAIPGDTILLDGTNVFRIFTQAFLRQGMRSLGFVGDISYAQTIADRWLGFRQGLDRFGLSPQRQFCHTGQVSGRYYHREEINEIYQEASDFPEAILCANDAIGYLVADRAESLGLEIGKDLLLTGYDGTPKPADAVPLTTAYIDTSLLGERLVSQLLLCLETPEKPQELIYLQPDIFIKESTGLNFQL